MSQEEAKSIVNKISTKTPLVPSAKQIWTVDSDIFLPGVVFDILVRAITVSHWSDCYFRREGFPTQTAQRIFHEERSHRDCWDEARGIRE